MYIVFLYSGLHLFFLTLYSSSFLLIMQTYRPVKHVCRVRIFFIEWWTIDTYMLTVLQIQCSVFFGINLMLEYDISMTKFYYYLVNLAPSDFIVPAFCKSFKSNIPKQTIDETNNAFWYKILLNAGGTVSKRASIFLFNSIFLCIHKRLRGGV